jgi:hypothetical protein
MDSEANGVEFGRQNHAGAVAAQAADDREDLLIPSMPKDANTLRMLDNAVKGAQSHLRSTSHKPLPLWQHALCSDPIMWHD